MSQSDAENLPETQNPYITLINKKIRALKKKHQKVVEIEKKVQAKEKINQEQQGVLANKDTTLKALQEFESMRASFLKFEIEEAQKETPQPVQPTTQVQPVQQQQPAKEVDERANVILLLKLVQASKLLDPSVPLGVETRNTLLEEKKNSKTITQNSDFDRIHWLTNAIFNIPADQASLERSLDYAMKFLTSSEEDFVPTVSYKVLRDELDELQSSSVFAPAPQEAAPTTETPVEATPTETTPQVEEAQPEAAQEQVEDESASGEEQGAEEGQDDKGFISKDSRRGRGRGGRGGRGRGRGGRGRGGFDREGQPRREGEGGQPRREGRPFEPRDGGQRRGGAPSRGSPRGSPAPTRA